MHHIPENPNPKSGIIPGSYSFESVLSAVADFKAPVFEPGGSMQQGMYTPKGTFISMNVFCQISGFFLEVCCIYQNKMFAFYFLSFGFPPQLSYTCMFVFFSIS